MKLMIVESPNKTKKIASVLGSGWMVKASVGHIRDMPQKEMGVAPPDFIPAYEPTDKGADVIKGLKAAVKQSDEVYLATDPDREGEAISWHLQQALGLRDNYKRVTFKEITKSGISDGLRNERKIDMKLVAAQEARRVLDRLVGYTVSPELCRIFNDKLSAGRVQSPALKILVVREREIRNFVSVNHFGVEATFDGVAGDWRAQWDFSNLLPLDEDVWTDIKLAEAVSRVKSMSVNECVDGEQRKGPYAPFTTSTLQQGASASLNIGAKKCMDLAQELFAAGLITYHRTDSMNLSDEAIAEIRGFAQANKLPLPDQPRKFKSKAGAQEAHEAIRPTNIDEKSPGSLTGQALALYEMIWKRAVASQLADAVYDTRKVVLDAGQIDGKKITFRATGSLLKFKGWKLVMQEAQEKESGDSDDAAMANPVPKLTVGQTIIPANVELQNKSTKPPNRYTQAKLTKELEDRGIGRPSTYAAIVEGLLSRGYVEEKKKLFIPTELGEKVFDALDGRFSFMELPFTRNLEKNLDLVAEGKRPYKLTVDEAYQQLMKEMPALTSRGAAVASGPPCPECGKGVMRRIKGPSGFFWGCSEFKSGCKCSRPDEKGKMGVRDAATTDAGGEPDCPECGKKMRKINGPKGLFFGCRGYPDCKKTLPFEGKEK